MARIRSDENNINSEQYKLNSCSQFIYNVVIKQKVIKKF